MRKFDLLKFLGIFVVTGILSLATTSAQTNLIEYWDGDGITGDGSQPDEVGWANTSGAIPWNDANQSGGCRFRDYNVAGGHTGFTNESDGSTVDTRQLMLRYDNGAYNTSVYSYPVTLEACKSYTFSWDYVCGGSATPPMNMTVGISTDQDVTGRLSSKEFTTTDDATVYRHGTYEFHSDAAGTYYITITGGWAWFGVNNLSIVENTSEILHVSESSLSFSDPDNVKTFKVAGNALTNDVTLTAPTGITLDVTSITAANAQCWTTVTATYDMSANITDVITVTSGVLEETIDVSAWLPAGIETGMEYYIMHEASGLVMGENTADNKAKIYAADADSTDQVFVLTESKIEGEYFIMNQKTGYLALSTENSWDVLFVADTGATSDEERFTIEEFYTGRYYIHAVNKSAGQYIGTDGTNAGDGIYSDKPIRDRSIWSFASPVIEIELNASVGMIASNSEAGSFLVNIPSGSTSVDLTVDLIHGKDPVIPDISGLSDGQDAVYDLKVYAETGIDSMVYKVYVHVQSAVEICYLGADSRGVLADAKMFDQNPVQMLKDAGYSVTFVDKSALIEWDGTPFDYTPYKALVIAPGVSSSNLKDFSKRDYPIPAVCMQPDAPRNDKWGWVDRTKADQMYTTKTYDATTAQLVVTNNNHYITENYEVDDTIKWTLGTADSTDWADREVKTYDLTDSIPEAVSLARIPADGNTLQSVWVVPEGVSVRSMKMDEYDVYERRPLANNVVILSLFSDGLLYAGDELIPLLVRSLQWAMHPTGNLLEGWDGDGITGTESKPNDVGWMNTTGDAIPWNEANGTWGCRFRDYNVTNGHTGYTNESDGSTVDTRQLMLRYDNGAYNTSVYSYPVQLEACTFYTFSWDYVCGGSATPPKNMTVGISTDPDVTGRLSSKEFISTSDATVYRHGTYDFHSPAAGVYYITITGDWAWFGANNLSIVENTSELLYVSESSLSFSDPGNVKTFMVAGNALADDVTMAAPAGISLDVTSITAEDAKCGVTVTATYDMSENLTGIITVTSGAFADTIDVTAWLPVGFETGKEYFIVHEASGLVIGESFADNGADIYAADADSTDQVFVLTESKIAGEYFIMNQETGYLSLSTSDSWNMLFVADTGATSDDERYTITEFETGRFLIHPVTKAASQYIGTDGYDAGSSIYSDKPNRDRSIWMLVPTVPSLSDISVDEGELWPEFDPEESVYQLNLPSGTGSVDIVGMAPYGTVTNPGVISLSDGDDVMATVDVTSPVLDVTVSYKVEIHVASQVEVLYLGKGDTYADAHISDQANVTTLRDAGYSVTYMDRRGIEPFFHDFDQFDYSPYAVLVWGSSVGSSDMKVFAKDEYPVPCLSIKADGPRSDKWGWVDKNNTALWKDAKLSDLIADPLERVDGLRMKVSANAHYITEPWPAGDTLIWTDTGPDTLDFGNITLAGWDLSDSIPEAIALTSYLGAAATYPTLSNTWVVPAGVTVTSLQMDDSYAQITLPNPVVILSAHSDATPYQTDVFGTLMVRSLEWLLTSEDLLGLKSLTPSVGSLVPDFASDELAYDLNLPMGTTALDLTAEPLVPGLDVDLPATASLSDGDYTLLDVVVTSFDGTTTKTYQVNVHVQTDHEVLYLGKGDAFYADAHISDLANVKTLKDAGLSVTYMDRRGIEPFFHDFDQFDYSPYEVIVWGSSLGSSDMKVFAKDNYPLPCVTIKADGPRSDKWGWVDKNNTALWKDAKLSDLIADPVARVSGLRMVVSDRPHWITEVFTAGDTLAWTNTGPDTLDFGNITCAGWDLSDSIPDAVALTSYVATATVYPTLSNSWAIPAGVSVTSLQPDDSYAKVTLTYPVVILSAHSDATPYQTDVFGTLLTRSIAWVLNPIETKNNDATLSDLKYDGTTVPGFAANILTYDVELAHGTTTVPTVTYTTTDDAASAVVTPAASLPGTTTVDVTAEDGTTTQQYAINFTVAPDAIAPSPMSNISIFPNPARDILRVANVENSIISIYNVNGVLLKASNNPHKVFEIDVSDLGAGVYILKVQMNEGVSMFKFMKE